MVVRRNKWLLCFQVQTFITNIKYNCSRVLYYTRLRVFSMILCCRKVVIELRSTSSGLVVSMMRPFLSGQCLLNLVVCGRKRRHAQPYAPVCTSCGSVNGKRGRLLFSHAQVIKHAAYGRQALCQQQHVST